MKRLGKEGTIPPLKNEFNECAQYIKEKMTKIKRTWLVISSNLLEVIHTDISETLPTPTLNGE